MSGGRTGDLGSELEDKVVSQAVEETIRQQVSDLAPPVIVHLILCFTVEKT